MTVADLADPDCPALGTAQLCSGAQDVGIDHLKEWGGECGEGCCHQIAKRLPRPGVSQSKPNGKQHTGARNRKELLLQGSEPQRVLQLGIETFEIVIAEVHPDSGVKLGRDAHPLQANAQPGCPVRLVSWVKRR